MRKRDGASARERALVLLLAEEDQRAESLETWQLRSSRCMVCTVKGRGTGQQESLGDRISLLRMTTRNRRSFAAETMPCEVLAVETTHPAIRIAYDFVTPQEERYLAQVRLLGPHQLETKVEGGFARADDLRGRDDWLSRRSMQSEAVQRSQWQIQR